MTTPPLPTELPGMLWWKTRTWVLLTSVFTPSLCAMALEYDQHGRSANRAVLNSRVPYGVIAFSLRSTGPWYNLADLPESWGLMPRSRGQ
jgi:hypothetical protein